MVAAALGLTLAVVPPTLSPDSVANALTCASSIDPRCQPANLPILIEAGVVAAGAAGGGTLTPENPAVVDRGGGGSRWGKVAQLVVDGAAGIAGLVGIQTIFGTDVFGAGGLFGEGLKDQQILTDPEYQPSPTGPGAVTGGSVCHPTNTASCIGPLHGYVPQGTQKTMSTGHVRTLTSNVYCFTYNYDSSKPNHYAAMETPAHGVILMNGPNENVLPNSDQYWYSREVCEEFYPESTHWKEISNTTITRYGWAVDATAPIEWAGTPAGVESAEEPELSGTVRSEVTCRTPNGTDYLRTRYQVDVVVAPGEAIPVEDNECDAGDLAIGVKVDWQPVGSPDWIPVIAETVTPPAIQNLPIEYPDCFGPNASPCAVTLEHVTDDGSWTTCGSIGQYCPEWATHPSPAGVYRCKYGQTVVALELCSMYRRPDLGVLPNTNPDGSTKPQTAPAPSTIPSPTGPSGEPAPLPEPEPSPIDTAGDGPCWPEGWGMINPLSWVLMPLECALKALFIPDPTRLEPMLQEQAVNLADTPLGIVPGVLDVVVQPFTVSGGGCQGPPWNIDAFGVNETFYPFSACEEPMAGIASAVRGFGSFALVMWTGLACVRYVASIIGFSRFGGEGGGAVGLGAVDMGYLSSSVTRPTLGGGSR